MRRTAARAGIPDAAVRVLLADGRASEPILGPELNGRGPVAAIPATDESARLHTNPRWDHAVGPLQLITDT